jgi:hypothetical protein
VERVVKGGSEAEALIPVIKDTSSANTDKHINLFILACQSLRRKSLFESLERAGIRDKFAELFLDLVNDCPIFPNLREKLIDIISNVCTNEGNDTATMLLGISPLYILPKLRPQLTQ